MYGGLYKYYSTFGKKEYLNRSAIFIDGRLDTIVIGSVLDLDMKST